MNDTTIDRPTTLGPNFLYYARHASPRILMGLSIVALTARFAVMDFGPIDLLIVVFIVLAWPFVEWLIHVFILHLKPFEIFGRRFELPVAAKHRRHHIDPWRLDILFIPLHSYLFSIPMQLVLWNVFFDLPQALTGLAFTFLMTLHYEWVHYLVHSRYTPKTRMYRRLWRNHRLHHCKNENYWMGVTMLAGDLVLGTAPDLQTVPTSPTCRTLGQEESLGA